MSDIWAHKSKEPFRDCRKFHEYQLNEIENQRTGEDEDEKNMGWKCLVACLYLSCEINKWISETIKCFIGVQTRRQ